MPIYLWILSSALTGAIAAWCSLAIAIYYMKSRHKEFNQAFAKFIQSEDLDIEIESFLEGRFDSFLVTLKQQIPLAAPFLGGSLASKLKSIGREEIKKMMPGFKNSLIRKWDASELPKKMKKEIFTFIWQKSYFFILSGAILGALASLPTYLLLFF